jgi:TonB family protein
VIFVLPLQLLSLLASAPLQQPNFGVGGPVTPPVPTYRLEPQITELARDAGFQGTVTVQVVVGLDGTVEDPKVAKRVGMGLDEEAMANARQWKFRPATKGGQPVRVYAQIDVNFRPSVSHDTGWMGAAKRSEDRASQTRLGKAFYWGIGIAQDYQAASLWFRKAAAKNDPRAESYLGLMYLQGQGVQSDSAQAVEWFQKGAEQGDVVGQLYLGKAYAEGDGVPVDLAQAYLWLTLAAKQPGQAAQAAGVREQLLPRMRPSEVEAGKALVASFQPKIAQ